MNPTVIEHGTLRLVSERNLVIAAWRDAPTLPQLHAVERAGRGAGPRHGKAALVNLILSGTPNFSPEVLAEVARMNGVNDLYTLGAAHVIVVPGLIGIAVRAFLSTTMLLQKPHAPTRIFGEVAPAIPWLVGLLQGADERWTAAQVSAVFARA